MQDSNGNFAIHIAAYKRKLETVLLLKKYGSLIHVPNNNNEAYMEY